MVSMLKSIQADEYNGKPFNWAHNGYLKVASISSSGSSEDPTTTATAASSHASRNCDSHASFEVNEKSNHTLSATFRSPHKLLNPHRQLVQVCASSNIKSDDRFGIISRRVGIELQKSAMCLAIQCWNTNTKRFVVYEGQSTILRSPIGKHLWFCTVKQNLISGENEREEFEQCWSHSVFLAKNENRRQRAAKITFSGMGLTANEDSQIYLRDGETWIAGLDIAFGPLAKIQRSLHSKGLPQLINHAAPLDTVGRDFVYKVGMKVAILVYSNDGPSRQKVLGLKDPTKVPFYYGRAKDTLILTGAITYVGEMHVEYDVNSFAGCSGAAVILLEKEHPGFMKAIAVHAGFRDYPNGSGANVGFKVTKLRLGTKEGCSSIAGWVSKIFRCRGRAKN